MHLVESTSEVGEAVNRAKTDSFGYCSNFFPSTRKLQSWITHGDLFCDQRDGVALFLRRDRDFWHLYFCAANPTFLQRAVTALPMLKIEPVVLDLIGKESALAEMVGLFEDAGFRFYNRLFRMARTVPTVTPSVNVAPDSRVVVPDKTDCQPILDLLLRSFDCRAEQIPMLYEIEAAVEGRQIRVARCAGTLAGLLFFETQGMTSTLRYWLIAPEFRSQRFGSGLMHRYFAEHPVVRRFLLWVVASNTNAIGKYEHYGFAPEGLVDYVLANEKIRP
jgi:GNAT superfamily N-acetyltransferase